MGVGVGGVRLGKRRLVELRGDEDVAVLARPGLLVVALVVAEQDGVAAAVDDLAEAQRVQDALGGAHQQLALVGEQAPLGGGVEALVDQVDDVGLADAAGHRGVAQVPGDAVGLGADAGDAQADDGPDQAVDLDVVDLLVRGHAGAVPRRVVHLVEDELVGRGGPAGALVDGVVVEHDAMHLVALDLQQVALDPVLEAGRHVRLEAGGVDPLLLGDAYEAESGPVRDPAADDQVGEDLGVRVPHGDAGAAADQAGRGEVGRIDHAEHFVVGDVVGAEVLLGEADDVRGDAGQPLGAVRLVAVVRRDGPQPALVGHLEGGGRGGLLVELHHFEGGRRLRVGELGEERLADVEEQVGRRPARGAGERHDAEDEGDADEGGRLVQLVHDSAPRSLPAPAPPAAPAPGLALAPGRPRAARRSASSYIRGTRRG